MLDGTWYPDGMPKSDSDGAFRRQPTRFHNWITADGHPGPTGDGGFAPESGRYHLYVSLACPWAHRTLIFRTLKGLQDHIGVSVVDPDMLQDGWTFATGFAGATGDRLHGAAFLHQVYARADPAYSGRVTVPVLWDRSRNTIVSNESAEIIRMFNTAFDGLTGNIDNHCRDDLRDDIDAINTRIYDTLNNGVYRCGFATNQAAYDDAIGPLFDTLDWIEARLTHSRYLLGNRPTEADWRLFPTLIRFDPVYHGHFKCSRRRIVDYPNIWAYTRELFQWPGVAATVDLDHIRRHYHFSHDNINPHRIVPAAPVLDYLAPHGRDRVGSA
jgi:putative glutathione S-transferase